jgi:hypothetical protein
MRCNKIAVQLGAHRSWLYRLLALCNAAPQAHLKANITLNITDQK